MGGVGIPPARTGSWFKEELRRNQYEQSGDAYEDKKYDALVASLWNVEPTANDKYLKLVKLASQRKWTHLRLLADFMQIGRFPRDWERPVVPVDQEDRWGRANIRILDYTDDDIQVKSVSGTGLTTEKLSNKLRIGATQDPQFRLYVVEDLSRNVIEALGTEFSISPDFFRAHIADYAWYNVRDRWREPQPLEVMRSKRNWFQIRYMTTRYFASKEKQGDSEASGPGSFEAAEEAAKNFNILRRPDDDKSRGWWDSENAVVALTRSRATFWHRPKGAKNQTALGVLLLDPTVSQGLPLWRGHRNFHPVPSTLEALEKDKSAWETPEYGQQKSFFEDFVYWAKHPQVFSSPPGALPREHLPVQTLLHLIGAEWLTMCDYIKTRLNQIDLEVVDPEHFADKGNVEVALKKLHTWRRYIPLYREMVSEILQHIFREAQPDARCPVQARGKAERASSPEDGRLSQVSTAETVPGSSSSSSLKLYQHDFKLVLAYLEEYQQRIDRLTSVVTAVMAVGDTRRAIDDAARANDDARNIGRLTWLATFFIPFSVVAGIFSMQELSEISLHTIKIYFATTIPVAVITVVFAWAIRSPAVRATISELKLKLQSLHKKREVGEEASKETSG